MKKVTFSLLTLAIVCVLAACSNILTYVRHDESKGNIQCNGEKGLKRDSSCTVNVPPAAQDK